MSESLVTARSNFQATSGEIAVINLESSRSRSWSRFFADPARAGSAEAVIEHEQVTAQFIGDVSALDRVQFLVAELVKSEAPEVRIALIQAQAASMGHRFADASYFLAQAETSGALAADVRHLRLSIDQARGTNLDAVLEARRKLADKSRDFPDLLPLASLLADMRDFKGAELTYRQALRAYRDVSPFPVALIYFHLGMLCGELVSEPDQSLAALWYHRAIDTLPCYTKARVHLAEICASRGRLNDAEALLIPAISSGDPEVHCRLADVLAAQGRPRESEAHMQAARSGYNLLLERHLLAFADHGAEFYAGSGNDLRRALELSRMNVANRPTLRAFEQAHAIAVSAGDVNVATELLAEATRRCSTSTAFRSSPMASLCPEMTA